MNGTLGLLLLLLPLAAPLIAQDTVRKDSLFPDTTVCHYYNETCANSSDDCPEVEHCYTEQQKINARCFATWINTVNKGVVVAHKGCIYHDATCQNQCVSEQFPKGNASSHSLIFYCCCHGDYCNSKFSWDPKAPSTIAPTRVDTRNGVGTVVICTFVGLGLILMSVIILYYIYRRQKMNNFAEIPTVESTALTQSHTFPSLCSSSIKLLQIKAQGRFGAVWKANYCSNVIAVKVFPLQDHYSWVIEKQIFCLPHMKHENLLQFIGVEEMADKKEYWLLTSYHENGSLYDYLKSHVLSWAEVCHISESLSRGLAYLHCEKPANYREGIKPAIAHRDFKSKNVLLKSNLTAVIADFGLAITFYPGQAPSEAHGQVGTRRYMAPEVLEGAITFQRDSFLPIDMYACALVLWEIISRCTAQDGPVAEYQLPFEREVGLHPTLDDMQEWVVMKKRRPGVHSTWRNHPGLWAVVEIMTESWDHDAEARLSASCIVERFAKLGRNPAHVGNNKMNDAF